LCSLIERTEVFVVGGPALASGATRTDAAPARNARRCSSDYVVGWQQHRRLVRPRACVVFLFTFTPP
jgi:hypothetical protein